MALKQPERFEDYREALRPIQCPYCAHPLNSNELECLDGAHISCRILNRLGLIPQLRRKR